MSAAFSRAAAGLIRSAKSNHDWPPQSLVRMQADMLAIAEQRLLPRGEAEVVSARACDVVTQALDALPGAVEVRYKRRRITA
jgi:hypothetical protein